MTGCKDLIPLATCPGPQAQGVEAPPAFSIVNRFCTAVLNGRAGRLTAKKRRFPALAVLRAAGIDAAAGELDTRGEL